MKGPCSYPKKQGSRQKLGLGLMGFLDTLKYLSTYPKHEGLQGCPRPLGGSKKWNPQESSPSFKGIYFLDPPRGLGLDPGASWE